MLQIHEIPKKIHFVFLSKEEQMPELFSACMARAKELHTDWEICLHNEDDADKLLDVHFPELKNLYHSYPTAVQRADIIRVLIVYIYGGFYLDLDIYCFKTLEPLLQFQLVLGEEKDLSAALREKLKLKYSKRVANYMFGSIPGHPFWLGYLNEIIERSLRSINDENDVLESTGPGVLTDYYHEKGKLYPDVILVPNPDRPCLNDRHKEIACHFGNYAAHLHLGTWRWQTKDNNSATPRKQSKATGARLKKYEFDQVGPPNVFLADPGSDQFLDPDPYDIRSIPATLSLSAPNSKKTVIYRRSPFSDSIEPDQNTTYVYCGNYIVPKLEPNEVTYFNKLFSLSIVPSDLVKRSYKSLGITTQIEVVRPAYRRFLRKFEDDPISEHFTIGVTYGAYTRQSLAALIKACERIQGLTTLPVKLKICGSATESELDLNSEDILIEFNTGSKEMAELSTWMQDIACMVFSNTKDLRPLALLETVYLGIPIIVVEAENYSDVLADLLPEAFVTFEHVQTPERLSEVMAAALTAVYEDFYTYNVNAMECSRSIEDRWTLEETQLNIRKLLTVL